MTDMGTRRCGLWLVIIALAATSAAPAVPPEEKYAAIVCFLDGQAWTSGPGGQTRRDLQLFDSVAAGALVGTAAGAGMVVAFSNGDRFEFRGEAKATVGPKGVLSVSGEVAKIAAVAVMPPLAELAAEARPGTRLSGIRLRGTGRPIVGLYPDDGAAALADGAVLSFTPLEGVEKYRVLIDDEWGNNVFSVETNSPRVAVSPGILKPGLTYYWSVRTLEKTRPSTVSEAVFTTLEEDKAKARNAFRAQAGRSQDAAELLLVARLDMALGLRQEACATLRQVLSFVGPNAEVRKTMERLGCK